MYDKYRHPWPLYEDNFDIWFRFHTRGRLRLRGVVSGSLRDYSQIISEDPELVAAVAKRILPPSAAILEDMGLTDDEYDREVTEISTRIVRCRRYV